MAMAMAMVMAMAMGVWVRMWIGVVMDSSYNHALGTCGGETYILQDFGKSHVGDAPSGIWS